MNGNPYKTDLESQVLSEIEKFGKDYEDATRRLGVLEKDVAEYRKLAEGNFHHAGDTPSKGGVSRRDLEDLGEFCRTAVAAKTGQIQKVAADLTISSDERGGYMVPTTVNPTVDALLRPYGSLLGAVQYHTVEPGRTHRIPNFSNAPSAYWQGGEGQALTELDVQIGSLERKPDACGGYVDISYQLFHQSAHDIGQTIGTEVLNAIRQKTETSLVQGDDSGTDPYDGLLVMSGTTSGATLATPAQTNMSGFVAEAVQAYAGLWDRGVLVMSPQAAEALREDSCSSAYTSRVNFEYGRMAFDQWPIYVTPAARYSSTEYVLMLDPRLVHVVNYGHTLTVDDSSGLKNLMITMAMNSWMGYGCSLPASVVKADITALA